MALLYISTIDSTCCRCLRFVRSFVVDIFLHTLLIWIVSSLGHLSKDALAAGALSDLWTMTTQVLLSGNILGVLVGGAVGAGNPKLAGEKT